MRRKVLILASVAVAAVAILGILAATHRFPFKQSAPVSHAVPAAPVVAGAVASHDVPIC
jgi:membrane fusion protein, multidrug efflux system